MIYRAIIQEVSVDGYKAKVRIPLLHKNSNSTGALPNSQLPEACIGIPAGIYPSLKVGDVVLVSFEENNLNTPIILGLLFNNNSKQIKCDMSADSLSVLTNAVLPADTTIGEISAQQIASLKGASIKTPLQKQLDNLSDRVKLVEDNGCGEIEEVLKSIESVLNDLLN